MLNKNQTYSPKEALAADPNWTTPVKLGRGRMPSGGEAHCRTLVSQGYRIKGYSVAPSSSTAPVADKPKATVKKEFNSNEILQYTIHWPEKSYKAVGTDGRIWSMREVCNNCRVSLVQCLCGKSTILGDIQVRITPK